MKRQSKQKLLLTGFLGFTFLFGCNQIDSGEVKAGLPSGYTVVTEDEDIKGYQSIYTLKNNFSGCFYTLTEGWESVALVQMFVEKDGVSVPYCE